MSTIASIKVEIKTRLEVPRGDNITWKGIAKSIKDGSLVNITGATFKFTIKENLSDDSFVFQKTSSDGISISDAGNGEFLFSLVPSDTNSLVVKKYEYDIEMTLSGKIQTIALGGLEVVEEATRPII